jgi:hypothetical protein
MDIYYPGLVILLLSSHGKNFNFIQPFINTAIRTFDLFSQANTFSASAFVGQAIVIVVPFLLKLKFFARNALIARSWAAVALFWLSSIIIFPFSGLLLYYCELY